MIKAPDNLRNFDSLLKIVEALRGPEGCPWDKEQTHRSLAPYAIEEAHELAEALESDDLKEMVSELGDLLLQVVLNAEIGRQSGAFTIYDVIEAIGQKMVRRHPHVFADVEVSGSAEVIDNWAKIKATEKQKSAAHFEIPAHLPALQRAQKIGQKTKTARFDWSDCQGVLEKVDEELNELKEAIAFKDQKEQEHEIGDLLFSVAQLARHLDLEAEQSLRVANQRFEKRYFKMVAIAQSEGRDFVSLDESEKEKYWQLAKAALEKSEL